MMESVKPEISQTFPKIAFLNYTVAVFMAFFIFTQIPDWILLFGFTLFVCSIIATIWDDCRLRARVPVQGKAVLITGCDSGFGHELSHCLIYLGFHVFAGCLYPDKEGAQLLKEIGSDRLHVVQLDVTSEESVQNALKYVKSNIGKNKFWALVNNAGVNAGGEVAYTTIDKIKQVFEVNTLGVLRMTQTFIPLLIKDEGRIVTVASSAGRSFTYPMMTPYCASKASVISYCEGLRLELYRFGVHVITIEPWTFKTDLTNRNNVLKKMVQSWEESSEEIKKLYPENHPEECNRAILGFLKYTSGRNNNPQAVIHCLEEAVTAVNPKYTYTPGAWYIKLLFWSINKIPKEISDRMISKQYAN